MNCFYAIALGVIQGLTEFLPISSSGHLMLAERLLGVEGGGLMFDLLLHVGTLLAVVVQMHKELIGLFKKPKLIGLYAVATAPAAAAGFFFSDLIDQTFGGGRFLWLAFLLSAVLLVTTQLLARRKKGLKGELTLLSAAAMGAMQAAALLPGLSRSGCTIFGGTAAGADREQVAAFSFLMSVPIILGGSVLSLSGAISTPLTVGWWEVLCGVTAAFVVGILAIELMLRIIKKASYTPFAAYLVVLSIISFICF